MTTLFARIKNAYTTDMSFFVLPTPSPRPKSKYVQYASLTLATIVTVMVVTQLFSYEKFADVIAHLGFEGEAIIAAIVVGAEVASLPFLLFMTLSPAARVASMIMGWLVVLWWFVASLAANMIVSVGVVNSGLLGATLEISSGWWSVFFVLGLAVLSGWVSWGLWPLRLKK